MEHSRERGLVTGKAAVSLPYAYRERCRYYILHLSEFRYYSAFPMSVTLFFLYIPQESYLLRRYHKVYLSSHRVKRRFMKVAIRRGIFPVHMPRQQLFTMYCVFVEVNAPFYEVATELSKQDHSCIYTDQVSTFSKTSLNAPLKEWL